MYIPRVKKIPRKFRLEIEDNSYLLANGNYVYNYYLHCQYLKECKFLLWPYDVWVKFDSFIYDPTEMLDKSIDIFTGISDINEIGRFIHKNLNLLAKDRLLASIDLD